MEFEVRGPSDAHILLAPNTKYAGYALVIGGWGNTKSAIDTADKVWGNTATYEEGMNTLQWNEMIMD